MSRRPRVALVCSEVIRNSGHGRYMLELARRLAERYDVHVYCDLYDPVPGVTHHHVPAYLGINLLRVYSFWAGASWRLRGADYDLVHTIGGCCTRRDVVTVQFTQRAWGKELAEMAEADREARAAGRPPLLVGSPLRRLYHALYWRMCDWLEAPAFKARPHKRLIAVSRGVREELATCYGTPREAVEVVYNGVEPAEWSAEALGPLRGPTRAELGFAPEDRVLLFVGDFYRKGLAVVIAALAAARTEGLKLLVVGRGEAEAFTAQAARLGVSADRLRFTGFHKDVRPFFAAADAFVFPTRYEPFGMVITEAMAAGLPTLTSAAAGASEVITHGVDGLVLPSLDDARAYADALDGLFADPAAARAMGEAARLAAARVDWDYVAAATERVYAELLASR